MSESLSVTQAIEEIRQALSRIFAPTDLQKVVSAIYHLSFPEEPVKPHVTLTPIESEQTMTDEEQHIAAARLRDEQRAAELGDYTPVAQVLELAAEVERLKAENVDYVRAIEMLHNENTVLNMKVSQCSAALEQEKAAHQESLEYWWKVSRDSYPWHARAVVDEQFFRAQVKRQAATIAAMRPIVKAVVEAYPSSDGVSLLFVQKAQEILDGVSPVERIHEQARALLAKTESEQ